MQIQKENKGRGNASGATSSQVRGKFENLVRYPDNIAAGSKVGGEKIDYPGAYKIGQKVLALMSDMKSWKVAEIYAVRPAKLFDETVLEEDDEDDDLNLLDDVSVLKHPKTNTNEENKLTYLQQYIKEFKEAQQQKKALEQKNNPEKETDEVNEEDEPAKDKEIDTQLQKSMRYEYYIHFLGIDRRSDRWATEQFLKLDDREINQQAAAINRIEESKKELDNENRQRQQFYNDENHGMSEKDIKEFLEATKFKTVESIQFGMHWLETWYFTPLPKEYHTKCLYICDFCLSFFVSAREMRRHSAVCDIRHPPGDEIYRDGEIEKDNCFSFFEIDGSKQRVYCENLSYISRMFLDHKNLYNSIEAFLFYVLCEVREDGWHFVGYFSKEKVRDANANTNNLSCIMVMPFVQRSGFGKVLIEMSYALGMIENKPGGPERPLSDLGHRAYVSFWTRRVVKVLLELSQSETQIKIEDIKVRTGMTDDDIKYVLNHQNIQVGDTLNCEKDFLESILKVAEKGRKNRPIIMEKIRWKPYITSAEINGQ